MSHDTFKWENVGKECLHVLYTHDIQEKESLIAYVYQI